MEQEFEIKAILKIRKPEIEDATSLHNYCFPSLKLQEVEEQLKADIDAMGEGKLIRLVADAGGYAVGNVRMAIDGGDRATIKVSDIVVAGPFRGLDVADKLMQVLADAAKAHGISVIQVQVRRNENRVIETFKRWGFSEQETITLEKHLG